MPAPSKPPLPPPPPEEPPRGTSWLSIFLATMLGLFALSVLFFLTQGVLGGVMVVGAVIFAITALHYFVWGRWLERVIRDSYESDDQDLP